MVATTFGVISFKLPRIALEEEHNEERFWNLLDNRLQLAKKTLMTRIARLENFKARVAPILYMEGACGVCLKADNNVAKIFKNGRASFSLCYIGVHETINALFGNQTHVFDNEQLREKRSPSSHACKQRPIGGKKKPATVSAFTVRRVKTCMTAFAVLTPLNSAWYQA